jgi:hypothetical protein
LAVPSIGRQPRREEAPTPQRASSTLAYRPMSVTLLPLHKPLTRHLPRNPQRDSRHILKRCVRSLDRQHMDLDGESPRSSDSPVARINLATMSELNRVLAPKQIVISSLSFTVRDRCSLRLHSVHRAAVVRLGIKINLDLKQDPRTSANLRDESPSDALRSPRTPSEAEPLQRPGASGRCPPRVPGARPGAPGCCRAQL